MRPAPRKSPLHCCGVKDVSHSFAIKPGKSSLPTRCPFVSSLYLLRIALQALFIGAKTPTSSGWRRWVVFGGTLIPYTAAAAGPPSIHLRHKFFPLYKMNGGSLSPEALPAQCTVVYSLPEPPPTSWTILVPLRTSSFVAETDIQNAVSSQFQRRAAVAGSEESKPALDSTSSTLSNHVHMIPVSPAPALDLLRCCGFCSASDGQCFRKHCHQSLPGTPPVNGLGMLWSLDSQ